MDSFSAQTRDNMIHSLKTVEQELLVIGGGITGAGILLDARSRGIHCSLIEMQDFAAGTSNRSTKLVHGGLRYLKQFEVGLVAEVGRERAIVYENGPHVTTPVWMLLPLIEGGSLGRLSASFGIWLYDRLARVKPSERRRILSASEALKTEPSLRKDGLKGAGYYVEYRTDDARLTLEIIKEAVDRAGVAVNYVKAEAFIYDNGKVTGVKARDVMTNESFVIRARNIVNAAGPWVDELRELDGSRRGKTLHWTKGVHIVVDESRFSLNHPVYFDVPDGRMVFAIPRDGKTYIGTTDTDFRDDLMFPRMTVEDRQYLVGAVNYMFPLVQLTPEDVESSWAGVRPLIHEEGKGPSEISRKDEVFYSPSGLVTIAGGKLTGYRKMAEKVVDIIFERLSPQRQAQIGKCLTAHIEMAGGKFGGSENYQQFITNKIGEGVALGLTHAQAARLTKRYGTNIDTVYSYLSDYHEAASNIAVQSMPKDLYAALQYGLNHELVLIPCDFFIRRTGAMYFDIDWVRTWKDAVIAHMARYYNWSPEQQTFYGDNMDERIEEATKAI